MSTRSYELRADDLPAAQGADAVPLRWPTTPGATSSIRSELGWFLQPWPNVSAAAVGLVRVAAAAYLADRLTPRPASFSRRLALAVAVTDPSPWRDGAGESLTGLLRWLTGDQWQFTALDDDSVPDLQQLGLDLPGIEAEDGKLGTERVRTGQVSLLSGGLDSFLGAVHLLGQQPHVAFVGHRDAATAVQAAQSVINGWLAAMYTPVPSYARVTLRQAGDIQEPSSRSRSLLFAALGIAATVSAGGGTLQIPENGYTSINLPLHPNRGGALSTRSTHPETFRRLNLLLDDLAIGVRVTNPFQTITKGEARQQVAAAAPPDGWLETAGRTLSCSKLDGGRIRGGNPNLNCGLCVSCLVRRGTFIAAGQPDHTTSLLDVLDAAGRSALVSRRRSDLEAVRYACATGVGRRPDRRQHMAA
jgi:hypothetical protein